MFSPSSFSSSNFSNNTSGFLHNNLMLFPTSFGSSYKSVDLNFNFNLPDSATTEGFYTHTMTQITDANGVDVADPWEGPVEDIEPNLGSLESPSALGPAVAVTMLNSQLGSYQTSQLLAKDYEGLGQAGHSFAINNQEKVDSLYEEQQTMIRGGLIAAGSLFGPEGLALGTAAAGLESAFSSGPPAAMIPSTTGADIPSSNVL